MESECPYKEIGQNFNLDFLKNSSWKQAETFTVVSPHENLQIHTQKKHR